MLDCACEFGRAFVPRISNGSIANSGDGQGIFIGRNSKFILGCEQTASRNFYVASVESNIRYTTDKNFSDLSSTQHVICFEAKNSNATLTIDNVSYNVGEFTARTSGNETFHVFSSSISTNNTITNASCGKLWYLKLWQSDILVFDGIPVRVGMTGYLYDRVSKQLFGNIGTGSFVLGPDIS